jgi:hypothetical protein
LVGVAESVNPFMLAVLTAQRRPKERDVNDIVIEIVPVGV